MITARALAARLDQQARRGRPAGRVRQGHSGQQDLQGWWGRQDLRAMRCNNEHGILSTVVPARVATGGATHQITGDEPLEEYSGADSDAGARRGRPATGRHPEERFDCDRAKADGMARTSVGVKGGFTVGSQAVIVGPSREGVDHGHDDADHRYHRPGNPARRRRVLLARAAMRAYRLPYELSQHQVEAGSAATCSSSGA
jgi:hypothetical protein